MLKQSKISVLKKAALAGAAVALSLGAGAPAFAGGSSYVSVGYTSGYYGGHGHYRHGGYYGGHHRYRGGRHYRGHRHGGGGRAAAIALGVIGGAIILNEVAESRERDRYYEARARERYYERDRYDDRYDDGFAEGYERGRAAAENDDYDDSGLDGASIGGELDGGPEPIRLTYARAYDACLSHARAALSERGFVLAAPYKPETAEENGPGWKMTATVSAERGSEAWSRAMYCEADESRVYRLELI